MTKPAALEILEFSPEIIALAAKYTFPPFPYSPMNDLNQGRFERLHRRTQAISSAVKAGGRKPTEAELKEVIEAQAWTYVYLKAQQLYLQEARAFANWMRALPGVTEETAISDCFNIAERIGDYTYRREDFDGIPITYREDRPHA